MNAIMKQNGYDMTNIQNELNAIRATRDTALTEQYNVDKTNMQADRTVQEYNTNIEQQKQNVRKQALANDILMSTSGRGQSQNLADTITAELTNQQTILANLQQSKDWALQEIAQNSQYTHQQLANNYNDYMGQFNIELQDKIKNLSDTGLAKTAQGMSMLQNEVEKTNLKKLALSQTYAQQLQFLTETMKQQSEAKKFDATQTTGYNDGYLHNANGEVIK